MHRTEWAVVMALPRPVPCLGAWQRQRLGRTGRVVMARGGGSKAQRPRLLLLLLLRLPRPPLPTSASPRTPSGDRAELGAGAATATLTRMAGVETAEAAQADNVDDQTVVS